MNETTGALSASALRATFPMLIALLSLIVLPIVRTNRFGPEEAAPKRAAQAVAALLILTSVGALAAGASYSSSFQLGNIAIDPSEPGRLMTLLGGFTFALIVIIGEGRRAGTMGQVALFGLAVIDLALALPIGLAPIALLLFASIALGAGAAGEKDDPARARAVFRDLRTAALLLPAVVVAEILRSSISLSTTDARFATPTSLGAGAVLALSLVALGSAGAFPFHTRLVRIFESLPIVGSLMIGVWIPTSLSLVIMGDLAAVTSSLTEPIGGAVVPGLLLAGAVTIVFAAISAALNDDIGEIVGYLAIGNAGWIAIAAAATINAPSDTAGRILAIPGALTISLFGLWLVAARRRYGITQISLLGGWARRTQTIGVILIAAIIALVALPPGAILAARLSILSIGGNPVIGLLALAGQSVLILAAVRLLLAGMTPPSSVVRRTRVFSGANWPTAVLLVSVLATAGAAAGWFAIEIGGSAPLPPPVSASPLPISSPSDAPSDVPSDAPSAAASATPAVSASP